LKASASASLDDTQEERRAGLGGAQMPFDAQFACAPAETRTRPPVPNDYMTPSGALRLAVAFALALLVLAVCAEAFPGKVIGVTDGETLTVLHDQRPETVRLNGIDAPETGQAFGTRAKQYTSALAFGQVVEVVVRDQDRYGRTVADVPLPDGRSLNQEIVPAGFAWQFRKYSNDATLAAAEAEARAARRGLWVDAHPVAPWEWRQAQRQRAAEPSPALSDGPVIGNRRSRIYHRPDCPNYLDVAPPNRVPFASGPRPRAPAIGWPRTVPEPGGAQLMSDAQKEAAPAGLALTTKETTEQ
jgi:micrococcal nuclease